jgi:prolyl-tRNA synthetase
MKMSRLIGRQIKESPKDASTPSHIFMLRGGYIRPVSAGIYSLLPLGKRVTQKIEAIIREEMNRIEGQEVLMPVVLPRELWEETGRYNTVGSELLRFSDRNQKDMLLGMTHEEAVVHLARTEVSSYKQLPFMLYQIQTKYRDEARPRAGLIRVREFTMKDGYSFHATEASLLEYYDRAHAAYVRIFKRMGMKNVLSIEADSGMMGGSLSHEFMAVADCGEDTLFVSPDHQYRANKEVATTALTFTKDDALPLEKVHTPGQKTIEEVAGFLGKSTAETGKAVLYVDSDEKLVFAVIRGDIEVNEAKLKKALQSNVLEVATEAQIRAAGAEPGYASTLGLDPERVRIVVDNSVAQSSNLIVGANEMDYHCVHFNWDRDGENVAEHAIIADIATARAGDPCPITGAPLMVERGIEVGNIFQLGTKYSDAMACNFLNEQGKARPMIMGCYGIGVGRGAAAVIEQSHDNYGPIWPITIAPFEVHIVALNSNKEPVREACDSLYRQLMEAGVNVLYDDRNKKAGFAFSDADLIGSPLRFVVSPKTIAENQVEFKTRDGSRKERWDLETAAAQMVQEVRAAYAQFSE